MDAGLAWTAAGTLIGGAGAAVAWWQARAQAHDRRSGQDDDGAAIHGMPVLPPTGTLPARVPGRDALLDELRGWVRRPPGAVGVLVGMGGVGKSTVAAVLAGEVLGGHRRGRRHPRAWWVSAADPSALTAGAVTVARRAGAPKSDLEAIAHGSADASDRLWNALDRTPPGWLLVFDDADDPAVLTGPGWLRPSSRGLVLVTSRHAEAPTWGRHCRVRRVEPLDEAAAALVLRDLAPGAGGDGEARALARRLGGLPLALNLAGTYLDSAFARWRDFSGYRGALDRHGGIASLGDPDPAGNPRTAVTRTWEISLDSLARRGIPQARAVLRLLSCYAPAVPIPRDLLEGPVEPLLGTGGPAAPAVERALHGLGRLGLVGTGSPGGAGTVVVHPVVADTNRAHLTAAAPGSGEPAPAAVRETAAALLTSALARLRWDDPADWPRYRLLGPHLHALHHTVADHLPPERLATLVEYTTLTARAFDRGGADGTGERLCRAALPHVPVLGPEHPAVLGLRHELAWEIACRGLLAEAEAEYRLVAASRRRILGDDHPDTVTSRHELAWVTAAQGRWQEAEALYRQVLADRRRSLGDHHPGTLTTRHELAWALGNQGRLDEAEATLRHVLRDRRRVLGGEHPQTLASLHELAWITAGRGELAEAETAYREVLRSRRRVLGDDHPETLTTRHELAWVAALRGRTVEARALFEDVLRARCRRLGDDHPETLATHRALERLRRGEDIDARHLA